MNKDKDWLILNETKISNDALSVTAGSMRCNSVKQIAVILMLDSDTEITEQSTSQHSTP